MTQKELVVPDMIAGAAILFQRSSRFPDRLFFGVEKIVVIHNKFVTRFAALVVTTGYDDDDDDYGNVSEPMSLLLLLFGLANGLIVFEVL